MLNKCVRIEILICIFITVQSLCYQMLKYKQTKIKSLSFHGKNCVSWVYSCSGIASGNIPY